ncbi:PREDICTED: mediator-associated 1 [Prunus dulcis]|uniref:PREDICTED: mediator-associated 1 n=1 Tax=Prunus dulcis TaxID=3755 RepID=A0A5E4GNL5_PRUDU|nr:PREDICTED: mediator-associated 1 [Prunus dulcis]VVA41112.1 PREDICTED: mediator-associated 1 [Prunus dulcis]
MAFSQLSSSSYESYSSSSSFDEDHQSDSYDDELEDEQLAPDSQESPTLVGSDTEYRCESEPDSEADSAKKTMTKTKTKTNTNVEAKSKNTSPSSTAVANEKRPPEKPEERGGDASNKKRKKAENETNLQTGGDDAVEKDKEMMKKKKKKSRSSSSTAGNARVWSERDELVLVKGIISFLKKFSTFDGKKFYNWINKYIEADVSTGQIADKVCRLKKKYRNNEANRGPNGEDPVFSKPHEQKLFDLSKQAWGSIRSTTNNNNNADINGGIVEKGADAQKKATDVVDDAQKKVTDVVDDAEKKATGVVDDDVLLEKEVLFDDNLVMEAFDKYLTSRGLDLRWFGRDKLESLENKWRKIRVAESTFRLLQAKFDVKLHQIALHACNFFDY